MFVKKIMTLKNLLLLTIYFNYVPTIEGIRRDTKGYEGIRRDTWCFKKSDYQTLLPTNYPTAIKF